MSTLIQRIPNRQYSKTEVCQLLIDADSFLKGELQNIRTIKPKDTQRLKKDVIKAGLLPVWGITEAEYNNLKTLRATWCELIFQKLM